MDLIKIATTEKGGLRGRVRLTTYRAGTKEILRQTAWKPNLIMLGTDTGKTLILQHLNGSQGTPLYLEYAEIGFGSGTPVITDTVLGSPQSRVLWSNGTIAANVLTLQYFFADGVTPNGTYNEFGTFMAGTSTVSTGRLFNRILFGSAYVKTSGEDTTVEVELTIT